MFGRFLRKEPPAPTYEDLDGMFLPLDKKHIRRTRNLRLIPDEKHRRGGKYSYAEWAHVIGVFQTLMYQNLPRKTGNDILDVGCGTGILGIAAEPYLAPDGKYTGLDVRKGEVDAARKNFPAESFEFIHTAVHNAAYTPDQTNTEPWALKAESFDLVTALSVWTHFCEEDAFFYLKEVARVLRPGARAIITVFLLDGLYEETVPTRTSDPGRYHRTAQDRWIFDQPAYQSSDWLTAAWTNTPEDAIAMTSAGLERLLNEAGLTSIDLYPGNWKEVPGPFFQDVLILEKSPR